MKGGSALTFVCCLVCFTDLSLASEEEGGLYPSILQEYRDMMSQVMFAMMTKSCRNACEDGGSVNLERSVDSCNCDPKCVAFGDCCLDYWISCNASFSEIYERPSAFRCLEPRLILSNVSQVDPVAKDSSGYEVITRCPHNFQNVRLKRACEKPHVNNVKSLPFVEGEDGRTFRNQHCAKCHGVAKSKRWETSLTCPNETMNLIGARLAAKNFTFNAKERQTIRETCEVLMKPPDGFSGTVCKRTIGCGNATHPDYEKCFAYKQPLYYLDRSISLTGFPVRNPHCARCRNIPFRSLFAMNIFSGGQGDGSTSLAILFDFSKAADIYGSRKTIRVMQKCKPGQVYDFRLKACRQQRILHYSTLGRWTCELQNETFANTSTDITIFKNRSIFVAAYNKIYEPARYVWHGSNVTVCGNLTNQFFKSIKKKAVLYSDVEFYMTLVGFSLSIPALLAVIVTYSLFDELRTLPGKIIINLSVALVLSQIVFLVDMTADASDGFCAAVAVSLHYLYIAAFCWMNAMAHDVSRTFAGKSHRSRSGSRQKVFLLCLLYAWGLPFVIVGVTLAMNYSEVLDVRYGNDSYCFLTNPIALAVFFAVPVVAMILFNIVALVRVLVAVRRVRKVTKKVRDGSTAGQDVRMCWKLTAVFGLTWVLGLAAGHHIVLNILFIVGNSLQGVFIMISFIMTRRILNLYLKKAGKEPLTTRTTGQKSSVTVNTYVPRKTSSLPLVENRPMGKQRKPSDAEEVLVDQDSPEARLVAEMEGPETKL